MTAIRHGEMRLLHIYSGNLYGGVESMLTTLARTGANRSEAAHEFALCFEGRLSEELKSIGASVAQLGRVRAGRPWSVWSARRRLAELLQGNNYQAAICHSPWPLALFGRTIRRHSPATLAFWLHGVPNGKHWTERWARRTPPDLAVCNSRYTLSLLPRMFSPPAAATISCPVPAAPPMCVELRRSVRKQWRVAEDEVLIIMASRMERSKGHRLLIDALSRMEASRRWKCLIVGGPQTPYEKAYFKELQSRAQASGIGGQIRFLGRRTDVRQLMHASDLFCHPNEAPESFGIVFVEALYAGLPVVTTRIGGGAEIVAPDCGLLVESTAAAVVAALTRLIDDVDYRRRLAAAGPQRAAALCAPDQVDDELVALLADHRRNQLQ